MQNKIYEYLLSEVILKLYPVLYIEKSLAVLLKPFLRLKYNSPYPFLLPNNPIIPPCPLQPHDFTNQYCMHIFINIHKYFYIQLAQSV